MSEKLVTEVEKINENDKEGESLETHSPGDYFYNFDIETDSRINYINTVEDFDTLVEMTNRLICMYLISGTSLLHDYLIRLSFDSKVDIKLKLEIIKSICGKDEKGKKENYDELDKLLGIIFKGETEIPPTPCLIDNIVYLLRSEDHIAQAIEHFKNIIRNRDLECHYRYKCISSLDNEISEEKLTFLWFELCMTFLRDSFNETSYRLLSAQILLKSTTDHFKEDTQQEIESVLSSFMNDSDLDYNVRADAADVLLNFGSEGIQKEARDVINYLSQFFGTVHNIYQNAQNVHHVDIEKSAMGILEKLYKLNDGHTENFDDTFDGIKSTALDIPVRNEEDILRNEEDILREEEDARRNEEDARRNEEDARRNEENKEYEIIKLALDRIDVDKALYGNFNCSLKTILLNVWTYVSQQEDNKSREMKNILLDELKQMSGKCSTGYAYRLLNVLSGFDEDGEFFGLKISFEEQIAGNLQGRLNSKLQELCELNPDFGESVLEEMTTLNNNNYLSRKNFLKFFRENLPYIKEDIYNEFKDTLSDSDIDLYLMRAVLKYEGQKIN